MRVQLVTRRQDPVRALMGTALLVVVLGTGSAGAAQNAVTHVTRGDLAQGSTTETPVSVMAHPEAVTAIMGWRMGVLPA